MALSLSDLKSVRASKPPRLLVYGPPGEGKTTLASEFPNPVFLQIEDGTPTGVELQSFGKLETYAAVVEAMQALLNEDHDFQTVVIDSVSELQKLVWAETCARGDDGGKKFDNIEGFGYGKGYSFADNIWAEILQGIDALRDYKKMNVVLIGHSVVTRFDDPETASYDRYSVDLHKRAAATLEREMDAIFLLKKSVAVQEDKSGFNATRTRAKDTGDVRMIYTINKPAMTAKNRYGMPPSLRYDLGKGYAALAPYFPNTNVVAAPLADDAHKDAA